MQFQNIFLIFLFSTLSFVASAENLPWNELELGQKIHLAQDVNSSTLLPMKKNDAYFFEELKPIANQVMGLLFKNYQCTDDFYESELELFNLEPEDLQNDKSIGIQNIQSCYTVIYLEPKYFFSKSLFE